MLHLKDVFLNYTTLTGHADPDHFGFISSAVAILPFTATNFTPPRVGSSRSVVNQEFFLVAVHLDRMPLTIG